MKSKLFFIITVLILLGVVGCTSVDGSEALRSEKDEGGYLCMIGQQGDVYFRTIQFLELPIYNEATRYWEATSVKGTEYSFYNVSLYCYPSD